ncbi:MAG TPA: hypothetical protein VGH55_05970, partial [Chthoniobacterales bacterium]
MAQKLEDKSSDLAASPSSNAPHSIESRIDQQRVAQLVKANAALRGLLDELASVPQLDEFIGQVMRAITGQLGAVSSSLWMFNLDDETFALELIYQNGRVRSADEIDYPKDLRVHKLDEVASWTPARLGQPIALLCLDGSVAMRMPEMLRTYLVAQGVKSLLLIPLSSKGQ